MLPIAKKLRNFALTCLRPNSRMPGRRKAGMSGSDGRLQPARYARPPRRCRNSGWHGTAFSTRQGQPTPFLHEPVPIAMTTHQAQTAQPQFGDADPRIAYNRVFFAILRIHRTLMPQIEKALREIGVPDPIWYEILLATEEAGEDGVQMQVLQRRLFVPQYALSRHVARIEKAGLIRRAAAGGAGRGQILYIAEPGRGLHARIWQIYVERIQSALAPALTTDEAYDLVRTLNRLYR